MRIFATFVCSVYCCCFWTADNVRLRSPNELKVAVQPCYCLLTQLLVDGASIIGSSREPFQSVLWPTHPHWPDI